MLEQKIGPLDAYLNRGISAHDVRRLLEQHDCLTFPQLASGMFPAANFDDLEADITGMAESWLRDTALVGMLLLQDGRKNVAARAARGVLGCLYKVRPAIEKIVQTGHAPADDRQRPAVRFVGPNSEPRLEWANVQNDALGYALQFIGVAASHGAVSFTDHDKELLALLIAYLETITYWQDADSGHWEEMKRCNASSIGSVVGGLEAIRPIVDDTSRLDSLISKGRQALQEILPNESLVPTKRDYDAALIFLIEPTHVVTGDMAQRIIANVEGHLLGDHGIRRYVGDSYWAPNYRTHLPPSERAADFSDPADMARRNAWLTPGGEAQWTLFDPMLAAYYARRFQTIGDQADRKKAHDHMVRSLRSIITHTKPTTGETVWRIPEAYFLENGKWVPNDHAGLLWAQANLVYSLNIYTEAFANTLIVS